MDWRVCPHALVAAGETHFTDDSYVYSFARMSLRSCITLHSKIMHQLGRSAGASAKPKHLDEVKNPVFQQVNTAGGIFLLMLFSAYCLRPDVSSTVALNMQMKRNRFLSNSAKDFMSAGKTSMLLITSCDICY